VRREFNNIYFEENSIEEGYSINAAVPLFSYHTGTSSVSMCALCTFLHLFSPQLIIA
jgi:hypothetical protein